MSMARTCTICTNEQRADIETALLQEEPLRNIAKRTGMSTTALFRHRRDHIAMSLVKAKQAFEEVQAGNLFERLKAINRETAAILAEARAARNHVLALQAIARAEKQIELEAKLLGENGGDNRIEIVVLDAGRPCPPHSGCAGGKTWQAASGGPGGGVCTPSSELTVGLLNTIAGQNRGWLKCFGVELAEALHAWGGKG